MKIKINDVHLYFDVDGMSEVPDGPTMKSLPTLIVLHGGPGFDHSSLKPFFCRFRERAQVVYLDHRGNGRSDRSDKSHWNLETWASDLKEFCDTLSIQKPYVLGHSFGGLVAMKYATTYPDHPGKLILACTSPKIRLDRIREGFFAQGGAEIAELALDFWTNPNPDTLKSYVENCYPLYNPITRDPNIGKRMIRNEELSMDFVRGERHALDLTNSLSTIVCPTLIIGGRHDPLFPPIDTEEFAACIDPKLRSLHIFEQSGHHVFECEPEATERVIANFLGLT